MTMTSACSKDIEWASVLALISRLREVEQNWNEAENSPFFGEFSARLCYCEVIWNDSQNNSRNLQKNFAEALSKGNCVGDWIRKYRSYLASLETWFLRNGNILSINPD